MTIKAAVVWVLSVVLAASAGSAYSLRNHCLPFKWVRGRDAILVYTTGLQHDAVDAAVQAFYDVPEGFEFLRLVQLPTGEQYVVYARVH